MTNDDRSPTELLGTGIWGIEYFKIQKFCLFFLDGEFQPLTVTAMSCKKYVLSQRVSEEHVKTQYIQVLYKRLLVSGKKQVHQHENVHPQLTCGP